MGKQLLIGNIPSIIFALIAAWLIHDGHPVAGAWLIGLAFWLSVSPKDEEEE